MLRRSFLAAGAAALLLGGCAGSSNRRPAPLQRLSSPATESLRLPFSEAVRVGSTLYVSGQIGNVPGTLQLVPGGIRAEARQVLENVRAILESHGSSLEHVAKCTVFLADVGEWAAFNEVYREFFQDHLPARSALGANGLALGARVEVECIAVVPEPVER